MNFADQQSRADCQGQDASKSNRFHACHALMGFRPVQRR
jgi:hypothetical protein